MKKTYAVSVRGREATWVFTAKAPPEHAEDWRRDGLLVDEIVNTVPEWAAWQPLLGIWVRVQDLWQWLRLW